VAVVPDPATAHTSIYPNTQSGVDAAYFAENYPPIPMDSHYFPAAVAHPVVVVVVVADVADVADAAVAVPQTESPLLPNDSTLATTTPSLP
jgi:hypothetical protein